MKSGISPNYCLSACVFIPEVGIKECEQRKRQQVTTTHVWFFKDGDLIIDVDDVDLHMTEGLEVWKSKSYHKHFSLKDHALKSETCEENIGKQSDSHSHSFPADMQFMWTQDSAPHLHPQAGHHAEAEESPERTLPWAFHFPPPAPSRVKFVPEQHCSFYVKQLLFTN